jgi:methylenetetrahydrofolate reductase (NADPH)
MAQTAQTAAATPRNIPTDRKGQIVEFMRNYSIETTPGSAAKINDYREHLYPDTKVAVTFLPGSDYRDTISTAARLRREGFEPAPHIAARSLKNRAQFEDYVKGLRNEADVKQVVVLGGAVDKPVGEYSDSMQLLESGVLDKHGIAKIGVAGHPEGSPDISDEEVRKALQWKNAFAERTDAEMYVVTQFVFESQPIIDWDRTIQAEGNKLPVHIGAPGLATLKTLVNHARACGIGASMRWLTRQAKNVTKLMNVKTPDHLVADLAQYWAEDPNCGVQRVHMYPLGGMRKSAAWANAVVEGDFEMNSDNRHFTINRDIT